MYRKARKGLLKHLDFLIIDLICLELSFYVSYMIREPGTALMEQSLYRNMFIVLLLIQIVVCELFNTFKDVLKRGKLKELKATVKNALLVLILFSLYLFLTQRGSGYSRIIWLLTLCLYCGTSYGTRLLWKRYLISRKDFSRGKRSLLIITSGQVVDEVLDRIRKNNYEGLSVQGIVLVDEAGTGQMIKGVPVVADVNTVLAYASKKWIDEVFINIPKELPLCTELINQFLQMGITVHLNLFETERVVGAKRSVERLSSYTVLTYSINTASTRQLLAKRLMDIAGGLVGCLFTLLLIVFIGPAIYIQSPGPLFFSQERVGKNGHMFKIYKFRSMYMDAEERKKELMQQNQVKDGFMFKMENDPRIIGSEKGPGKGIGHFIRKTSIDEFPQFWNVLKGDMSLVGTRPPTLDEWEKYSYHHRARLATKPGMTGMWQVSGRSDIRDFDEVVKLDLEYIENWSIGLDIKILFRTVMVVLKGKGSM